MKDFNYPIMNPESDIPSLLGFTNDKIMHYINRQNHNLDHFRNEFSRLRHQNDKLQRMLVKSVLNITYSEPLTFDEITRILRRYESPKLESSTHSKIPIKYINEVKRHYKGKFKYKYRGKSIKSIGFKRPQSHVTEAFATSFALYKWYLLASQWGAKGLSFDNHFINYERWITWKNTQ